MWWRCPNEDSSPLIITINIETSSSLKYELKVALQQVLSVELNTEHTTCLQLAHSLSFMFMFNPSLSCLKQVRERNQPETWLLPSSKFMANFWVRLSTLLPQLSSALQIFHTQLKPSEQPSCYFTYELDGATNPHPLFSFFISPRPYVLTFEETAGFPSSFILLTGCVEVKVGRLIGNVPCCLQSRSLCCHFACISLGFVNIHFKWALRDVLPSKQDWNLETDSISSDPPGRGRAHITTIKQSTGSSTCIPNTKSLSLRGKGPSIPQPSSYPCSLTAGHLFKVLLITESATPAWKLKSGYANTRRIFIKQ